MLIKNPIMELSTQEKNRLEREFIHSIVDDLHNGYWFVPFIGAGMSVPAGIPSAPQLKRYLTYCFLRASGVDPLILEDSPLTSNSFIKPWNPRQLVWPSLTTSTSKAGIKSKFLEDHILDDMLRGLIVLAEENDSLPNCTASAELLREMYGSLSDWRSAILLLSRLSLVENVEHNQKKQVLIRTVPEESVIDSFFSHLVGGREPTLGHRMIHALSPVLRADVILTTNFDDLIEKAFSTSGTPLALFEVPLNSRLPVARLVHPQKSLIKLNGGRFGVRADYSIDIHPTRADRWHFLSYLAGRPLDAQTQELPEKVLRQPLPDTVAMLFCGVSGDDDRTRALVDLAIGQFANLRIYWLCFTEGDAKQANRVLKDKKDGQRFKILRHPDHGLFLLQLYQECTNTLPTSGAIVPSLWQVPFPPIIPEPKPGNDADRSKVPENYNQVKKQLRACIGDALVAAGDQKKPVFFISEGQVRGAVTVCANLFYDDALGYHEKTKKYIRHRRLWLNTDDITEPAGVLLRLALMISQLGGDSAPISTLDVDAFYDRNRVDDFIHSIKHSFSSLALKTGQRLVVFINTLSGVGKTPIFSGAVPQHRMWIDSDAVHNLARVLHELATDDSCGVCLVAILRSESKDDWKSKGCPERATAAQLLSLHLKLCSLSGATESCNSSRAIEYWLEQGTHCSHFDADRMAQEMVASATPKSNNPHVRFHAIFCYLLTIFRIPRFPATLVRVLDAFGREESAGGRNSPVLELNELAEAVPDWIDNLVKIGAVRQKVGGLIWLDLEVKQKASQLMHESSFLSPTEQLKLEWLVARAYGRLLLASSDPLCAVECIYHTLHAVESFALKSDSGEICGWNLLPVLLQHAELVFNTAKDLLKRRLSDQFAEHSLYDMQARCEATVRKIAAIVPKNDRSAVGTGKNTRSKSAQTDLFDSLDGATQIIVRTVLDSLRELASEIVATRSDLYLLEGSFQKVGPLFNERPKYSELETTSRQFQRKIDLATASLCLRDYTGAYSILKEVWKELKGAELTNESNVIQQAQEWLARFPDSASRNWMVITSRHLMYLRMHQSQSQFLAAIPEQETLWRERNDKRVARLEEALRYYSYALEILRGVSDTNSSFVYTENARLRSHAGLCRGVLALSQIKTDAKLSDSLALARVQLIDAESYIEEFPMKEVGRSRAVLELRRAELQLIEAGADPSFREFRRLLRSQLFTGKDLYKMPSTFSGVKRGDFRVHLIFDAMRSLQRAEQELRKQPKSRWWWWLLIVLRMKTCEYLFCNRLMVRLSGASSGLPHSSPTGGGMNRFISAGDVPIVLSKFLREDVSQLIREKNMVDPWQLARLADSHACTFFAMRLHAKVVSEAQGKEPDQAWEAPYRELAKWILRRLATILDRCDIDGDVRVFAQRVIKTCEGLYGGPADIIVR